MFERSDFSKFELQVANFCILRLYAIKFVCTVLTDLATSPILLNIDGHVHYTMMHV